RSVPSSNGSRGSRSPRPIWPSRAIPWRARRDEEAPTIDGLPSTRLDHLAAPREIVETIPMKVAHINHSYGQLGGSGTEQSVPNTCALLAEHGVQTCVLYERQTGPSVDAPHRGTYRIPGLCSYSVWPRPAITERALALLEAEAVDIVHLHQTNNGHLVRAVAA